MRFFQKRRHRGDRRGNIVLDRAAVVALRLAEILADAPEHLGLFEAFGNGSVGDQTLFDTPRQNVFQHLAQPICACEDSSISTYQGCGVASGSRQPAVRRSTISTPSRGISYVLPDRVMRAGRI
jgi:hypothetical protein